MRHDRTTAGEVEGLRIRMITDPSAGKIAELAAVFGVPPPYLRDQGKEPSVLDEEVLEAITDETAGAILRESARLPEREKGIVLGIVRQFAGQSDVEDGR